jgi:dynein heavy chain
MYLKKALDNKDEIIPWGSLKYLIGEAMYGGRVTDDYDRRVLVTYLDEYMGDFLFDKNRDFFFAQTSDYNYNIPKLINSETLIQNINDLPLINSPEIFGLHPNAEITYFTNSSKSMWENLILMQTSGASSTTGVNKEEYVGNLAMDILGKMPPIYDVVALRKEAGENLMPTKVVLFQELERFNRMILKINESLNNLIRALKGEIGMSSDLDELSLALYNGFLPAMWRRLTPQTEKKLGGWIEHFIKRNKQYDDWVKKEEPVVMWLSGLHIPESYLTALVQTTCRAKGWALDKSTLYTVVTKVKRPEDIRRRPEHGCFAHGLYLEGAGWDVERGYLKKQK